MAVLYISAVIIILDQLTKFLVKGGIIPLLNIHSLGMPYGDSINVFGDFFKITFVENQGLAFGIDVSDSSKLILTLFHLAASIGILYYMWKSKDQKLIVRVALAFILGGAIGNFIDRAFYGVLYGYAPLFYGRVVDFLNVDFFDFTIFGRTFDRWPIFNIADSSISIGVVFLLIFHKSVPEKDENKEVIESADTAATDESTQAVKSELSQDENQSEPVNDGKDSNREENKD